MARSSGGSGPIAWAPGNQNCDYAVLFDATSTSITSHEFAVDNNFVRVAAFNLSAGEVITIEQISGLGAGSLVADYAPVNGPVTLYYNSAIDQRTSYTLERPGRYRAKLTSGELGLVTAYAVKYYVENEASQDIADALFAVLREFQKPFNPCTAGAVIPADSTANNVVVSLNDSECLVHQPLVSAVGGNLIQLKPDGVYYGIAPPTNFANQYVSSSTGDDTNPGTQLLPLQTIQKALSNLPDGTAGNIFLLAGDIFHTYPTATGDVINTLTFGQGAAQAQTLATKNKIIQFFPYNDTAINDIENYNIANATGYNPFIAQQTNFPEIHVTLSESTDTGVFVVLGFIIGPLGSVRFNAIKFVMGSSGTANPPIFHSGIVGNGDYLTQGGYIVLSEVPVIGNASGAGQMNVSPFETPVLVDTTFPYQPRYAVLGNQLLMVTSTPISSGNLIVPALAYTNTGDTMEQTGGFPSTTPLPGASYDYVALGGAGSAPLWENIVIYDHTVRSYRRLFTSIDVQT